MTISIHRLLTSVKPFTDIKPIKNRLFKFNFLAYDLENPRQATAAAPQINVFP
jgi:hypothetical protein